MKIFTYSPDLALLNKYLEAIIQCLEQNAETEFGAFSYDILDKQLSNHE